MDEHLKADIPAFIKASEKYLYRPYDVKYELDDGKIYCSELLYKAYLDATGRELGELVALGDMNWRPYRQTIIKYEGGQPPLERQMITPRHMSESDYLGPKLSFGL